MDLVGGTRVYYFSKLSYSTENSTSLLIKHYLLWSTSSCNLLDKLVFFCVFLLLTRSRLVVRNCSFLCMSFVFSIFSSLPASLIQYTADHLPDWQPHLAFLTTSIYVYSVRASVAVRSPLSKLPSKTKAKTITPCSRFERFANLIERNFSENSDDYSPNNTLSCEDLATSPPLFTPPQPPFSPPSTAHTAPKDTASTISPNQKASTTQYIQKRDR